jgi:ABC-type bacteriocin/lantibiotic exporter with double-glycine peptidase domain
LFALIRDLVRPYRLALGVVLVAMLVQTAAALATPWPLKVILDSVVGHHPLPKWLAHFVEPLMATPHGAGWQLRQP